MFERFKIDNYHHHHLQVQCIACNGSSCQISTSHRRRLVHVRTARKLYYWGHNLERNRTTHWNASDENHSAGVHKAAVGSTAIVDLPTHTHTHARTDTHTHTHTYTHSLMFAALARLTLQLKRTWKGAPFRLVSFT